METYSRRLSAFLSETRPFAERVGELSEETAVELYDMYDAAANAAALHIHELDTEIRMRLCAVRDEILERVIDFGPLLKQTPVKGGIYTPAVHNYRTWQNVELMKDKGIAGYSLAKETNARPVMYFGTKGADYPYLSDLPGMELLFRNGEKGAEEDYYEHLHARHTDMDTLILHGMYEQTLAYLNEYRRLRPDGKVYCGLDMNSHWMSRIPWGHPMVRQFARQCDIVATSCRSLRDALNRNPEVGFSCRWFPNGFLNPTGIQIAADFARKEDVILAVGRIGTAEKNNEELLVAFANTSNALPGWKVRLVGPIEPEFQSFISQLFELRPDLKKRIILTGQISNKAELYNEYARAKIFAFTSPQEGGTPNVYAEALFHGCMFVTSDIDAADDVTNFGELGAKYKFGDFNALADALVILCSETQKRSYQKHISKALAYADKYYDWNRNAKKLAYMLYR